MTAGKKTLISLAILIAAAGTLYWGAEELFFAIRPCEADNPKTTIIELTRGLSHLELSKQLESQGVVCNGASFHRLGRITRSWGRVKAGEYLLSSKMTPLKIFSVLMSGISLSHPLTIREGENMYEIAADLEAKRLVDRTRWLALLKDPKVMQQMGFAPPYPASLEGFLFPDTYFFNKTTSPEEMLRQMIRRFNSVWTPEFDALAAALGLTRHQVVTLASVIEKETGSPEERPMISSVFHNRLKKRMKLQSDPTIIYGIWERYTGNLHKSDILSPTPYNTYTVPALPAGPIGNPGKESIEAALKPVQSKFLFFVSHNDGTHEFTSSLKDHESAVRKFQIDPKARQGKSWRDLKKNKAN